VIALAIALPVLAAAVMFGETNLLGHEIWHAKRNRRQRQ
jgi:hypothetical protein